MAQSPSVCQLCETDKNIEWKCYECDILFCDGCRVKIHSKLKISDSHHVLNIKTCREEDSEIFKRAELKNKPCEKHAKQKCIFYCCDCDKMICAACLPESHSNHQFKEIEEAFDEKLTEIKSIQEKTEKQFEVMARDAETLEKFLSCSNDYYKVETLRISLKYSNWLKLVKQKWNHLTSSLQVLKKESDERISKEMVLLQEGKQILLHRTEKIDETLKSFQPEEVFNIVKEMEKENIPIYDANVGKRLHFISNCDYKSVVQTDFIVQSKMIRQNVSTDFKIIGKYVLGIPGKLVGLCICKNDPTMAWIYNDQNLLRKVYLAENDIQTIKEINVSVHDISMDRVDTLFVLVKENTEIKTFKRKRKLKTFLNMSPHYPISIHITKNNEIIIGLIKDKECKVVVLSKSGEKIHSYELDAEGKRIFTYPHKITSNNNGDIWVVDCPQDSAGRVVVLKKDGNFNLISNANVIIEDFCPGDIATASTGHVIIINKKHHTLCIYTMNGTYLTNEYLSIFKDYLCEKKRDETTSHLPEIKSDIFEKLIKETEKYFSLPFCIDAGTNGLLLVGGETRSTGFIQNSTGLCVVKLKSSETSEVKQNMMTV